ncbi:hypothetical protein ONE63_011558 [Megalurothrips usitatus]|uniref:Uncharacterized protein n=1 Tax=Megalurothrips usitatus TaxID=439358 RepID=A0AAV7X580_9NEOP|nr:hypothetical protein ONE63_011558 [Megalurothrips usitatus]
MEESNVQFIMLNETSYQICAEALLPVQNEISEFNPSSDETGVQQGPLLNVVSCATSSSNNSRTKSGVTEVPRPASKKNKHHTKNCAAISCSGSGTKKYFTFPSVVVNNTINQNNLER